MPNLLHSDNRVYGKNNNFIRTMKPLLKPGLIEYSEFLLPFELFFRDVKCEDLSNEDMYLIKLGWSTQHKPHTKTFLGIEIHLKI